MASRRQFFTDAEIRALAARSDWMGALLVAHCWAVIFGSMALFVWWPNVLTFLFAFVLIGSRQLGLVILMHDAAHNALFKTPWLNEFTGDYLCGRPVLAELDAYRRYHLKHHRYTQTDEDPDLVLSKPFPTTRASLRRKFLRDLTGRTGLRQRSEQFAHWMQMGGDKDAVEEAQKLTQKFNGPGLGRSLLVNLILFAGLAATGHWWLYPVLWILPMLTWYQFVLRVRNIAEHGAVERSDNPLRNVRTTKAGLVMRALLAPYWVNYHLEHHLVMHVPCWRLKKMHQRMLELGHRDAMEIGESYADVLRVAGSKAA
ncbi:MAG: fatty acid desaturase family protein [Pseudomonadota bacterium]